MCWSIWSKRIQTPPIPTLLPYTTRFRSQQRAQRLVTGRSFGQMGDGVGRRSEAGPAQRVPHAQPQLLDVERLGDVVHPAQLQPGDRKSTRLNSSHVKKSYADFC